MKSNDIPSQMKILNMVIPILVDFNVKIFVLSQIGMLQSVCHSTKSVIINDVTILDSMSRI